MSDQQLQAGAARGFLFLYISDSSQSMALPQAALCLSIQRSEYARRTLRNWLLAKVDKTGMSKKNKDSRVIDRLTIVSGGSQVVRNSYMR